MDLWWQRLVVALAAVYVLGLGWAMMNVEYEYWGAFVLVPILGLISVPILRRIFDDEWMFRIAVTALVAKLLGVFARYYIVYEVYGSGDATGYHSAGRALAGDVRAGRVSLFELIPDGIGTAFLERATGTIYFFIGSSRLAGFVFFGWMAYWGALWFVRAAMLAVPRVAERRYLVLVMFAPSTIYWPSSIGKEAWLTFFLGLASWGGAHLLTGRRSLGKVTQTIVGLGMVAFVRPHFAAIWVGALVVALVFGLLTGSAGRGAKGRFGTFVFAGIAVIGLVVVAGLTLRYLDPPDGGDGSADTAGTEEEAVTDQISAIFDETTRRSSEEAGSSFQPMTIGGPQTWPFAVVRTLTRPLPFEARSFAEMIPAAEMSLIFAIAIIGWRRLLSIPGQLRRSPYFAFAVVVLLMFGLAFTSIGNLGILTRQRSLIMPLFLLMLALRPRGRRRRPSVAPPVQPVARQLAGAPR